MTIRELRAERDRLAAIVAKLPTTADGVPIVPGMTLYIGGTDMGGDNVAGRDPYAVGTVAADHVWASQSDEPNACWPTDQCYATAAARDAAWPVKVEDE